MGTKCVYFKRRQIFKKLEKDKKEIQNALC